MKSALIVQIFCATVALVLSVPKNGNSVRSIEISEIAVGAVLNRQPNQTGVNLKINITQLPQKDTDRRRRFIPFARPTLRDDINTSEECSSSMDDFPPFITGSDMQSIAVILAFIVGIYCFTLLAIVCDNYFLPCVEKICEALDLSPDVAAATFMSGATSAPELFVNIIGTFITKSDLGIGTIVGSSLFNSLGVAAVGSLAAPAAIQLHWWPLTRDVIIYIMAVLILVGLTWDNNIYWYEALILFIIYFVYLTVLFQNKRINRFVKKIMKRRQNKVSDSTFVCDTKQIQTLSAKELEAKEARLSVAVISVYGSYIEEPRSFLQEQKHIEEFPPHHPEDAEQSLFSIPKGTLSKRIFFFYTWPIKFILCITMPNPKTYPKLFPLTFIMCILWIGSNSYIVSWMITIIGNQFAIPDAVLGLTFLAAGGCLPEAISITIMSRRGEGSMGISNSLGANTMNILLSLGMPWFFKTMSMGPGANAYISIQSGSIEYTILALIAVACALYLTLYFNKFQLRRRVGIILLMIYCFCIVLAILSEMVFFKQDGCI